MESPGEMILFIPLGEFGHLIPTLKLAQRFREDGYRVCYYVKGSFAPWLRERGFECSVASDDFALVMGKRFSDYLESEASLRRLLKVRRPSLVMMDIYVSTLVPVVVKEWIPISTYTVLSDMESRREMPLESYAAKDYSVRGGWEIFKRWVFYSYRRWIGSTVRNRETARIRFYTAWQFFRLRIRFGTMSAPGFAARFSPMVLGPRVMSDSVLAENRYAGFCLGESFGGQVEEGAGCLEEAVGKVVYCSFGSMSFRYEAARAVFKALFEVARELQDFHFVIQAGDACGEMESEAGANVSLVRSIDQMAILRRASLAVIHGGYGSVKECIANGVPMLVVPFFGDQFRNARRVKDAGIGDCLRPRECTVLAMRERIQRLSESKVIAEKLAAMYSPDGDAAEFNRCYAKLLQEIGGGRVKRLLRAEV